MTSLTFSTRTLFPSLLLRHSNHAIPLHQRPHVEDGIVFHPRELRPFLKDVTELHTYLQHSHLADLSDHVLCCHRWLDLSGGFGAIMGLAGLVGVNSGRVNLALP